MKTPFDFGAIGTGEPGTTEQDTAACQALTALDEPIRFPYGARFRLTSSGAGILGYRSGAKWDIQSTLLIEDGWAAAYAICPANFLLGDRTTRTQSPLINFSNGGSIEYLPGFTTSVKGIGIVDTDGAVIMAPRVTGGTAAANRGLYAFEVRNSSNGLIEGGYLSVITGHQGCDGIHFIEGCSDWLVSGLEVYSGDDASSLTHEVSTYPNKTIERIRFFQCKLRNVAHSAVKLLNVVSGCQIKDIFYQECELITEQFSNGQGGILYAKNAEGLTINDESTMQVVVPSGGTVGGTTVNMENVDEFTLDDTGIEFFSRQVLDAKNCQNLTFTPSAVDHLYTIPAPSVHGPLCKIDAASGAYNIVLPAGTTGYTGQTLIGP